ncbi:PEGA domain-containing protein [Candidatus Saccharibacteria bacterium]|nr:PEGA domain-containing protein [Candidatus Saccharibacteria bacterium]
MSPEELKKRQSIKVIVSEAIMVLTVIITVIILAFIVSGYWINSDFEVERQGMLQISSIPTGADVSIDGETAWLQRTNTSKVLPVGEHTVKLTKENYDSWSKTVNITEGLLYRIHYPRLFLKEREKEKAYDAVGTTKIFVSDNHEEMLLYSGNVETLDTGIFAKSSELLTTEELDEIMPEWILLNINSETIAGKPVERRKLYDFFKKSEPRKKDSLKDFGLELDLTGSEELIFSKFYDDYYLTVFDQPYITVYKKGDEEAILKAEISFTSEKSTLGHDGEFIIFSAGPKIATLDMETMKVIEWSVDGETFAWFDDDMIYSIKDGELFVYDYDGLNRRLLSKNVSTRFPVIIVKDKWLYYFSDDTLMREWLIPR